LKRDKKSAWTGVRNFQARNFMRDSMKIGDGVLYYHSNGKKENPTGVYGLAKVASKPYMDETQFDKKDDHYDPKSKKENPTWILIDMSFVKKFKNIVTLNQIKFEPKLQGIMVAQAGSLLSIQPVSKDHFEFIINMGH
jgi:predicted RNA-binding protein with PUA-like domain